MSRGKLSVSEIQYRLMTFKPSPAYQSISTMILDIHCKARKTSRYSRAANIDGNYDYCKELHTLNPKFRIATVYHFLYQISYSRFVFDGFDRIVSMSGFVAPASNLIAPRLRYHRQKLAYKLGYEFKIKIND